MKSEVVATYLVQTPDPHAALLAICRGQSVGNPTWQAKMETPIFRAKWEAYGKFHRVLEDQYEMEIHWPANNFGTEGVNYLLSVVMGGQCDVDVIQGCRLMHLELGSQANHLGKRPRYGIQELRTQLQVSERPFLCGIIKPKIGMNPRQLMDVVQQMVEGGCDVVKEDEILADQFWCPMRERLDKIAKIMGEGTLYLACVTGDGSEVWKKARIVAGYGHSFGVHCNLWTGLGTYADLRAHVGCPIMFQKSGDKVWTTGPFSIDYAVICQLINRIGCDIAHVGMYGGYLAESVEVLQRRITALGTTLPSFSCGMTPPLATKVLEQFGQDVMVTSGGWIHAQPEGIVEACKQMRRAIDARCAPLPV